MAFYNEQTDDELDPNNQQGGIQTGPGSGVISSGTGAPSGSGSGDKSGNFVGIKQYLDANKPQAAKLGDQAAGVIGSSADQAKQGIQTLTQEADSKIKAVNPLDQAVVGKLQQGAETLTDQEKNQIKQTAGAKYTGPKTVQDLGDTYTNAAKANQTAITNIDNSGTEEGRMNLISQINSKPRTQGMNVFDNTLLQAGGGREKLAQAAAANQGLKGQLDQATTGIGAKIGQADNPATPEDESSGAIGQTAKAQSDATKQIQDALNAWKTSFQPKVAQTQQQATDLDNRIRQDFAEDPYGLKDETSAMFGITPGTRTYGADVSSFFTPSDLSSINADTVASQEDYARYAALADLAGETPSILNPANASKAGQFKFGSVDKAAVQDAIAKAKDPYIQEAMKKNKVGEFVPQFADQTGHQLEFETIPELQNRLNKTLQAEAGDMRGPWGDTSEQIREQMWNARNGLQLFKDAIGEETEINSTGGKRGGSVSKPNSGIKIPGISGSAGKGK